MSRFIASMVGGLILAILAAGLAEATLAIGQRGSLSNDTTLRPVSGAAHGSPKPVASPTPPPKAKPSATPILAPTPSATPAGPTATTSSFVHLRAQPTTSSEILANLNGGIVVQLLNGGNSTWQEVKWNGITGFVYVSYLTY